MAEQYCPECDKKNWQIHRMEEEMKDLRQRLTQAQEEVHIPPLRVVLDHCQNGTCAEHAREWIDEKARVIKDALDHMTDDQVRAFARSRGLIPPRLVIK